MPNIKNIKYPYIIVALLFASAFFARCARPSAPVGGPKDTIAPELIKVTPANLTTNFDSKEIVLVFNEYVVLKDINKEVIFSPPMNVTPQVINKGKSIIVKFPHELILEDSTTYKIDFGQAIRDNNEGNPARRYNYVFSTANSIEKYAISGRVNDAITGDSVINALVALYDSKADSLTLDSTIFKSAPISIARTDSSGVFLATNLKDIEYKIYAIQDENGSGNYEAGSEMIGISNRTYNPLSLPSFKVWNDPISKRIYATPQFEYHIFKEKTNLPQSVKDIKRPQQFQINILFNAENAKVDSVIIDSVKQSKIIQEFNHKRDSLNIWIDARDKNIPDSLNGYIVYRVLDTLGLEVPEHYDFKLFFKVKRDADGNVIKGNADEEKDKRTILQKFSDDVYDWNEGAISRKIARIVKRRKRKEFKKLLRKHKKLIKQGKIPKDSVFTYPTKKDTLKVDTLNRDSLVIDSLSTDSITYDSAQLDSIRQRKLIDELCTDTIRGLITKLSSTSSLRPNAEISLIFDYPITTLDSIRTELKMFSEKKRTEDSFDIDDIEIKNNDKDTSIIKVSYIMDSLDMTRWRVIAKLQADANYELMIPSCAIEDLAGNVNDSLKLKFNTIKSEKTGSIIVKIKKDSGVVLPQYIINLADSTNKIIESIIAKDSGEYIFEYIMPKKYKIKLYEDVNRNDTLDMGSLVERREPERVATYKANNTELNLVEEKKETIIEIDPVALFKNSYPSLDEIIESEKEKVQAPLIIEEAILNEQTVNTEKKEDEK
ncbi:MAG: Ig-like domain-containing protein [Bacteroidetes bacterium]|nr:Ig-like domain-containing protein [Bacteroidota bacterium]